MNICSLSLFHGKGSLEKAYQKNEVVFGQAERKSKDILGEKNSMRKGLKMRVTYNVLESVHGTGEENACGRQRGKNFNQVDYGYKWVLGQR